MDANILINRTTEFESAEYRWCESAFGADELVATGNKTDQSGKRAYQASGAMGDWLMQRFDDQPYHFVTAEFGTFSVLQVLRALHSENQAFHYCALDSVARVDAWKKLEDCFCPRSQHWRDSVVARGVRLIDQAAGALHSRATI